MNSLIIETLKELSIPMYYLTKTDDVEHSKYIVYTTTQEELTGRVDGDYEFRDFRINIRLYSKTDYTLDVKKIENLLKDKGFVRKNSAEFFEKEIEYYLKSIFFEYTMFERDYQKQEW